MFNKVVVANRGAIAARVLRALDQMGIKSVALYSEADYGAPYLEMASETYAIGASPARDSYLNQDLLLDVFERAGVDGVHPGYGFLSENAQFAERVQAAGINFIGPSPKWIHAMGHKTRAREIAAQYGMPMSKGSAVLPVQTSRKSKATSRRQRVPSEQKVSGHARCGTGRAHATVAAVHERRCRAS